MDILIIEDNDVISNNIKEALESEGYQIEQVFNGILAQKSLRRQTWNLVIIDINLPGIDGYTLCADFRTFNTVTPILMLTAFAELEDKVAGFNVGADDYLTKPFFMKELLLRVKSLLNRSKYTVPLEDSILNAGDIIIDISKKTVQRAGQIIELTPREYQILFYLAKHYGDLVSKVDLVKEIWGNAVDVNTNTIEVYINFLRNKIDKPFGKQSIKTKVGFGYYLES